MKDTVGAIALLDIFQLYYSPLFFLQQTLACSILTALLSEFSSSSKTSNIGLSMEFHGNCKRIFQVNQFCIDICYLSFQNLNIEKQKYFVVAGAVRYTVCLKSFKRPDTANNADTGYFRKIDNVFFKNLCQKGATPLCSFYESRATDLYAVGLFNSLATNCKQNEYPVEQ